MVTDFILDALFAMVALPASILPGRDVLPAGFVESGFYHGTVEVLSFLNYVTPFVEVLAMLSGALAIIGTVATVRFLISLIPGVG